MNKGEVKNDNYYFDIVRHNIKKYRKERGMTQQELADKSNVTMNYIAEIIVKRCKEDLQLVYLVGLPIV